MNLYQCQEAAKDVGFDKSEFVAFFPVGPVLCKWVDAYMGFLEINGKNLMVHQVDRAFPTLECTNPIVRCDGNHGGPRCADPECWNQSQRQNMTTKQLKQPATTVQHCSFVGYYSTELNPDGICVESEVHKGSVQIYPASALELVEE